jgi:hypothetical protein
VDSPPYDIILKTSTFGDLNNPQLNNPEVNPNRVVPVRDISEHGFNKIADQEKGSGTACRRALHDLCCDIFEAAGLEVIFSMFKHDHMKIIKQKCLDALTNILCVPVIEEYVLRVSHFQLSQSQNYSCNAIVFPYFITILNFFSNSPGFYEKLSI